MENDPNEIIQQELMIASTFGIDATLQNFFGHPIRCAVIIFTLPSVLQQFRLQTTSFLAVLCVDDLATGVASKGALSNVAAGVMLMIFRPFGVGDFIEGGGLSGTVVSVGLFTTEMKTDDGIYTASISSRRTVSFGAVR
jgi:small conductance mechanosensitive channel